MRTLIINKFLYPNGGSETYMERGTEYACNNTDF